MRRSSIAKWLLAAMLIATGGPSPSRADETKPRSGTKSKAENQAAPGAEGTKPDETKPGVSKPAEAKPGGAKEAEAEIKLSKTEQALIDRTNDERKKQKLEPLTMDPGLMAVARKHTANMVRLNKMSHELEGKNFVQRLEDAGYKSIRCGENVAEGFPTPEKAIAGWLTSPGHRANIMSADYTHIGVGIVKGKSGRFFYTQVFAKPAPTK